MNAIELFGGETAAIGRMTKAVRDKLTQESFAMLREMEDVFRLEPGTLTGVLIMDKSVDYALFEVIAPALRLTIHDVLGRPDLGAPEIAEHWQRQMVEFPLQLIGSAANNASEPGEIDLELYVTSRAIEELNAMGDVHSVSRA